MRHSILVITAAIFCIVGGNFLFVASQAESGWATLTTHLQNTLLDWVGLGHMPVTFLEPSDQAAYWLVEVDRLESQISNSAAKQMGAAWVLDATGIGFYSNHLDTSNFASVFRPSISESEQKAVQLSKEMFRARCIERCQRLANRATELEPDRVDWWRMRALLLFEGDTFFSGKEFEARCEDWLEILEQCAQHDPDNALYDYLAALQSWRMSAKYDWPDDPDWPAEQWQLTIKDEELFAAGTDRFLAGQQKPFLAIGEAGFPAITEFLQQTNLRKTDQADVAVSRLVTLRHSHLFCDLWRWQNVRTDHAQQQGDIDNATKLLRHSLRLTDQAFVPEETSALSVRSTFATLGLADFEELKSLLAQHPEQLQPGELAALREREIRFRVDAKTLNQVLQQHAADKEQSLALDFNSLILEEVSIVTAVYLLAIALSCWCVTRIQPTSEGNDRPIAGVYQFLVWILTYGVTFLVLGVFPAKMISWRTQAFLANFVVYGLASYVLARCVLVALKKPRIRKLRFRLTTMFAATTVIAFIAFLWPIIDLALQSWPPSPAEWLPVERGWGGYDVDSFRDFVTKDNSLWPWAVFQWHQHHGHLVSWPLALLILSAWSLRSHVKQSGGSSTTDESSRWYSRWPTLVRVLRRNAAVAGACSLLVYFCVTPDVIRWADREYHYKIDYCRDPSAHYARIREDQDAITSSPEQMELIREEVEFELSGDQVFDRDFGE